RIHTRASRRWLHQRAFPEILCAPNMSELHQSAAALVVSVATDAIERRGVFTLALAGGSTPRGVYTRLAGDPTFPHHVRRNRVYFFWGDERHVAPDDRHSNFRLARESMLDRLSVDSIRVRRIKGEYQSASRAAEEYERDLRSVFDLGETSLPAFDLILLGL